MEVFFATSNQHKFDEASAMLRKKGIRLSHLKLEHRELRSDSLEEIAREAVSAAHKLCGKPVFVEDSGLFIDALNGFPGTFSAWTLKKIGTTGILNLMRGAAKRDASFEACIAFHDGKKVSVFKGVCPGAIALEARGSSGFGYDPVFIPHGESSTFAENIELKTNLSHRYKALLEFSKSLMSER